MTSLLMRTLFVVSLIPKYSIGVVGNDANALSEPCFKSIYPEDVEHVTKRLREQTDLLHDYEGSDSEENQTDFDPTYLEERQEELRALALDVDTLKDEVASLVHRANRKQLEDLEERLQRVFQAELTLRMFEENFHESSRQMEELQQRHTEYVAHLTEMANAAVDASGDNEIVPEIKDYVSKEKLEKDLRVEKVLGDSDKEFMEWTMTYVKDHVENFWRETMQTFQTEQVRASSMSKRNRGSDQDGQCLTSIDAIHTIQSELNKWGSHDNTGLLDLAQQSHVVHEMTTPTFNPEVTFMPPSSQLGSTWWRKYIPEDWEALLPSGWENWNIGNMMPSYLLKSLSLSGSSTAPPEVVLHPNIGLGSCWPMAGSSGRITLHLVAPINIKAVSIDHVPSILTSQIPASMVPGNNNAAASSAPRKFRVIGYQKCEENSSECESVGFDAESGVVLGVYQYDNEGVATQMFEMLVPTGDKIADGNSDADNDDEMMAALSMDEEEEQDELSDNDDNDGSCSGGGGVPSCSGVAFYSNIQGIAIEILDNWGNPDYTSLYRVRVHGDLA